MNIWKTLFMLIWGPVFAVMTPYLLYPAVSGMIVGLVDTIVFVFITGLFGLVIADILTAPMTITLTKVMHND